MISTTPKSAIGPADKSIVTILEQFDVEHVSKNWETALHRLDQDPEAAITSARSLIESVCKHILGRSNIPYEDKWDLKKLHSETTKCLNLGPDNNGDQTFWQFYSGGVSIIDGISRARNKFGDAHGKGEEYIPPSGWHAELCVNMAGSLSKFLVRTFLDQNTTVPNITGEWRGDFCGNQTGILTIKQDGKNISATLATANADGNPHETFTESLNGKLDGTNLSLMGKSVHNTTQEGAPEYNLDNFYLELADDGKSLNGTVKDDCGEHDADFTKIE